MAAKDQDTPKVDSDLESRAFSIYCAMAAENRMQTKEAKWLSEESFRLASAFNETLSGVRDGTISTKPFVPPVPKVISIPRMLANSANPPGFEAAFDPKTRKPIHDDILQDQGAFCPNAPLNHPANARFAPLDGRTAEEHINEAKAQLRQLALN